MNFMQAKYKDDHTNAYDNSVAKKTATNKILKAANLKKNTWRITTIKITANFS